MNQWSLWLAYSAHTMLFYLIIDIRKRTVSVYKLNCPSGPFKCHLTECCHSSLDEQECELYICAL